MGVDSILRIPVGNVGFDELRRVFENLPGMKDVKFQLGEGRDLVGYFNFKYKNPEGEMVDPKAAYPGAFDRDAEGYEERSVFYLISEFNGPTHYLSARYGGCVPIVMRKVQAITGGCFQPGDHENHVEMEEGLLAPTQDIMFLLRYFVIQGKIKSPDDFERIPEIYKEYREPRHKVPFPGNLKKDPELF